MFIQSLYLPYVGEWRLRIMDIWTYLSKAILTRKIDLRCIRETEKRLIFLILCCHWSKSYLTNLQLVILSTKARVTLLCQHCPNNITCQGHHNWIFYFYVVKFCISSSRIYIFINFPSLVRVTPLSIMYIAINVSLLFFPFFFFCVCWEEGGGGSRSGLGIHPVYKKKVQHIPNLNHSAWNLSSVPLKVSWGYP